ncbi:MAG: DUF1569 domain-containing protein [Bacteroidetes bacterium]|nr:DUF1569 domain-containing protein [Bacteroidota bacterium]
MNNLFNKSDVSEILARIDKLTPTSQAQWGKMNVGQMLAHLNTALETALGLNSPKRLFIGRILGPFVKANYLSEKPLSKNAPTDKFYIYTDNRDFEHEKIKCIDLVKQFFDGGASKCTTNPHSFFGNLTPDEWALSQWKHFDHHLRQFGV